MADFRIPGHDLIPRLLKHSALHAHPILHLLSSFLCVVAALPGFCNLNP